MNNIFDEYDYDDLLLIYEMELLNGKINKNLESYLFKKKQRIIQNGGYQAIDNPVIPVDKHEIFVKFEGNVDINDKWILNDQNINNIIKNIDYTINIDRCGNITHNIIYDGVKDYRSNKTKLLDKRIIEILEDLKETIKNVKIFQNNSENDFVFKVDYFLHYLSKIISLNKYILDMDYEYEYDKTPIDLNVNINCNNTHHNPKSSNVNITNAITMVAFSGFYNDSIDLGTNDIIYPYFDINNIIKILRLNYNGYNDVKYGNWDSLMSNIIIDKYGNIYEYIDTGRGSNLFPVNIIKLNRLERTDLLKDVIVDVIKSLKNNFKHLIYIQKDVLRQGGQLKPFYNIIYNKKYYESQKYMFITMLELLIELNDKIE
jgi:hypothetical protein